MTCANSIDVMGEPCSAPSFQWSRVSIIYHAVVFSRSVRKVYILLILIHTLLIYHVSYNTLLPYIENLPFALPNQRPSQSKKKL